MSRLPYRGWVRRLLELVIVLVLGLTGLAPTAASARVEPLPSGTDADYQLGGADDVPDSVGILVRDRTARPARGVYNVCYVNGFQTQPDQKRFWRRHWDFVLRQHGRAVVDDAWGEWLLDLRTPAKRRRLAAIVGRWTDGCAAKGFRAVEYDNLDSFTRSRGLLDRVDALAFARVLVRRPTPPGWRPARRTSRATTARASASTSPSPSRARSTPSATATCVTTATRW